MEPLQTGTEDILNITSDTKIINYDSIDVKKSNIVNNESNSNEYFSYFDKDMITPKDIKLMEKKIFDDLPFDKQNDIIRETFYKKELKLADQANSSVSHRFWDPIQPSNLQNTFEYNLIDRSGNNTKNEHRNEPTLNDKHNKALNYNLSDEDDAEKWKSLNLKPRPRTKKTSELRSYGIIGCMIDPELIDSSVDKIIDSSSEKNYRPSIKKLSSDFSDIHCQHPVKHFNQLELSLLSKHRRFFDKNLSYQGLSGPGNVLTYDLPNKRDENWKGLIKKKTIWKGTDSSLKYTSSGFGPSSDYTHRKSYGQRNYSSYDNIFGSGILNIKEQPERTGISLVGLTYSYQDAITGKNIVIDTQQSSKNIWNHQRYFHTDFSFENSFDNKTKQNSRTNSLEDAHNFKKLLVDDFDKIHAIEKEKTICRYNQKFANKSTKSKEVVFCDDEATSDGKRKIKINLTSDNDEDTDNLEEVNQITQKPLSFPINVVSESLTESDKIGDNTNKNDILHEKDTSSDLNKNEILPEYNELKTNDSEVLLKKSSSALDKLQELTKKYSTET